MSITTSGAVNLVTTADVTTIESSNIHVETTCRSGYDLTLVTSTSDNNLYLNGDIANNAENHYVSPSDGVTSLVNAPNTWGYLTTPPPLHQLQTAFLCQSRPIHCTLP